MAGRSARARSSAARKGWQTRRARAAERSRAAIKGWKTRRQNERKAERKASKQRAQRRERYRLTRERDRKARRGGRGPAGGFDDRGPELPSTTAGEPEPLPQESIDSLDDFIDLYDDAYDYDEIDVEITPSYKDK